jgi:hypothetical protein
MDVCKDDVRNATPAVHATVHVTSTATTRTDREDHSKPPRRPIEVVYAANHINVPEFTPSDLYCMSWGKLDEKESTH